MLSPRQIALIQAGFARIVPRADAVAALFYERLFELRPDLRPLFPADMTAQRGLLVTTLASVIQGLAQFDALRGAIRDLGRRHAGYRVESAQYGPVGQALIDTLARGLGREWTEEAEAAWRAAYAAIAHEMLEGAAEGRHAAE